MSNASKSRSAKLQIALVALIFFGPLALAWTLYYGLPGATSGAATNAGQLLDPARPLPTLSLAKSSTGDAPKAVFRDQWTLLTVAPAGCRDACRASLADTRQVRALLHRRSTRVQRVLVSGDAGDGALRESEHPDLRVFTGSDRLTQFFAQANADATGPGTIYLIDPLGNWVLFYPPTTPPDAVFKDIKHLLKLSHIG